MEILSELQTLCTCELLEPGGVRSGGTFCRGVSISVYITLFIPGTPDPCEYYPEKYHLNMHINKQSLANAGTKYDDNDEGLK